MGEADMVGKSPQSTFKCAFTGGQFYRIELSRLNGELEDITAIYVRVHKDIMDNTSIMAQQKGIDLLPYAERMNTSIWFDEVAVLGTALRNTTSDIDGIIDDLEGDTAHLAVVASVYLKVLQLTFSNALGLRQRSVMTKMKIVTLREDLDMIHDGLSDMVSMWDDVRKTWNDYNLSLCMGGMAGSLSQDQIDLQYKLTNTLAELDANITKKLVPEKALSDTIDRLQNEETAIAEDKDSAADQVVNSWKAYVQKVKERDAMAEVLKEALAMRGKARGLKDSLTAATAAIMRLKNTGRRISGQRGVLEAANRDIATWTSYVDISEARLKAVVKSIMNDLEAVMPTGKTPPGRVAVYEVMKYMVYMPYKHFEKALMMGGNQLVAHCKVFDMNGLVTLQRTSKERIDDQLAHIEGTRDIYAASGNVLIRSVREKVGLWNSISVDLYDLMDTQDELAVKMTVNADKYTEAGTTVEDTTFAIAQISSELSGYAAAVAGCGPGSTSAWNPMPDYVNTLKRLDLVNDLKCETIGELAGLAAEQMELRIQSDDMTARLYNARDELWGVSLDTRGLMERRAFIADQLVWLNTTQEDLDKIVSEFFGGLSAWMSGLPSRLARLDGLFLEHEGYVAGLEVFADLKERALKRMDDAALALVEPIVLI